MTGAEGLFARLFNNLSQWVGNAGCEALFSRAFLVCEVNHPVCAGVRFQLRDAAPHLELLPENARLRGGDATVEGMTEVVASILTMLTGLIGDERIAMELLEDGPPAPRRLPEMPSSPKLDATDTSNSSIATNRPSTTDRRCGHDRRHHD